MFVLNMSHKLYIIIPVGMIGQQSMSHIQLK